VIRAALFGAAARFRLGVGRLRGSGRAKATIALKFEAGKAFFAGAFPELEAELGGMTAGGGYEGPGRSRLGGRDGAGDDGAELNAERSAAGEEVVTGPCRPVDMRHFHSLIWVLG
jgi:hypothetical protein